MRAGIFRVLALGLRLGGCEGSIGKITSMSGTTELFTRLLPLQSSARRQRTLLTFSSGPMSLLDLYLREHT
jgi:hypothetical protein